MKDFLSEINIQLRTELKKKPNFNINPPTFGKISTDHVFLMDYEEDKWNNLRIVPNEPMTFDLSCVSFHYAQTIFEGMKAYKSKDGEALLFRPRENAIRFNKSAERMCMPQINEDIFVNAIKALVDIERDWIPNEPGTSLYIRPFMMATETTINLTHPLNFMFCVLLYPVGHLTGTFRPVNIVVEEKYIRAAPGGTGSAKCGGNYAGAMIANKKAKENGFDQVLWLDINKKYIEEVSAMNVFFVTQDEIITPLVSDTILDGITRKSVIEMLRSLNIKVTERNISIEELVKLHEEGMVSEVFSTGTAAAITPVGSITYKGYTMNFNKKMVGDLTNKLYNDLTGIQKGDIKESWGWVCKV
ncbi:MAG: branched-chain amino acid aminotransferase [Defluviitaleaceae bacterium]|nr:branched-chain amino acid aminotransferase [Defluviitaleaceae bacterium]